MADLGSLLIRTSRTFALAIPELPQPTRREVEIAYLLFRIADTFEDATRWSLERKVEALHDFERLLDPARVGDVAPLARVWRTDPPLDHDGYVELLGETPAVLEVLASLRPQAQEIIRREVARTARGMATYAQQGAELDLHTLEQLRDYCYVVAGIVGEMLTELFLVERPGLDEVAPYLRRRARDFGEGLQLVNILKDAAGDVAEGRSYLPQDVPPAHVFALARHDLRRAEEYASALERAGAPSGLVAFSALPVLLAWKALDRVEERGPGAKLTRPEVAAIIAGLHRAQEDGVPVMASVRGGAGA